MPKVVFQPSRREVEVVDGENLLQAAARADVLINASCGGEGTCGKCKVRVQGNVETDDPRSRLSADERDNGMVLACQTAVAGDLTVEVPLESELLGKGAARIKTLAATTSDWNERLGVLAANPVLSKIVLNITPPSLADSVSDSTRLLRSLRKELQTEDVGIDIDLMQRLGGILRDGDWHVTASILQCGEKPLLANLEAGDTTAVNYILVVDIGTTTISAQIVDVVSKTILAEASSYNAQISCGEDVISRMVYAKKGDGMRVLQDRVAATIEQLVEKLAKRAKVDATAIGAVVVAGNTVMTHLLLGVPTDTIREAPYVAAFRFAPLVKASDIGLQGLGNARVLAYPCVASYLGGDITSGVVASGLIHGTDLSLYIDVGTNGEIVLGNSEWLLGCSCSAGPAFEGAGVKDGVRSIPGAIEKVSIDRDDFETVFDTIGGKLASGVCGSGLIDLMAEMLRSGVLDKRGKIDLDIDSKRVRQGPYGPEFVVAWESMTSVGHDIVITEVDVDNLMRAKAAVYAGITTLVDSVGVRMGDLERVFIAGSFGNYIRVREAVSIGLLPDLPEEKYSFVGNGSLLGCAMAAVDRSKLDYAAEITKAMSYQELSADNTFMERYMAALFLPHTDESQFPSLAEDK